MQNFRLFAFLLTSDGRFLQGNHLFCYIFPAKCSNRLTDKPKQLIKLIEIYWNRTFGMYFCFIFVFQNYIIKQRIYREEPRASTKKKAWYYGLTGKKRTNPNFIYMTISFLTCLFRISVKVAEVNIFLLHSLLQKHSNWALRSALYTVCRVRG